MKLITLLKRLTKHNKQRITMMMQYEKYQYLLHYYFINIKVKCKYKFNIICIITIYTNRKFDAQKRANTIFKHILFV